MDKSACLLYDTSWKLSNIPPAWAAALPSGAGGSFFFMEAGAAALFMTALALEPGESAEFSTGEESPAPVRARGIGGHFPVLQKSPRSTGGDSYALYA
jgi:hypothetical protein